MGRASWKHLLVIIISLTSFLYLKGQINDCVGAQIICDDGLVEYQPLGAGNNDFANPKNKPGCLATLENLSAWYYFEFRDDMPPGYEIEFTITPVGDPGDKDFDFAIFGPNLSCDSLGEPVRCSFASKLCTYCPETGLGRGAREFSEGANGDETDPKRSDGFVAAMIVNPGEGFYLLLDNFIPNIQGFQLKWGGRAAPYLNCLANPQCKNRRITAGKDMKFCDTPAPFNLSASASNVSKNVKYQWTSDKPETLRYLDSLTVLQPKVTLPAGFTGTLDFILNADDGDCVLADAINIQVGANPPLSIEGRRAICQGESTTLSVPSSYKAFRWSNGDTTSITTVRTAGTYAVTVTNEIGCQFSTQTMVTSNSLPQPVIIGGKVLCINDSLRLRTDKSYNNYLWSINQSNPTITVFTAGTYSVTVTDGNLCQGVASINIVQSPKPVPKINLTGKPIFCKGDSAILSVSNPIFRTYDWSSGDTTRTIIAKQSGIYVITVTDANGCTGSDTITIQQNPTPTLTISGNKEFCEGSSTQLTVSTNALQTKWSNGDTTRTITANQSASFSVTVTDGNGCTNTTSAQVRERPASSFQISGQLTICPNNSATLEVQNQKFAQYRWSNGDTTATTRVTQPGVYTLQATDSLGCTSSADFTLAVFPTVPQPRIRGKLEFCPGASTTLSVDKNYTTYRWSNGDSLTTIQALQTGVYVVTVTDSNGCMAKDSVQVKSFVVAFPPAPAVSKYCTGNSVALNAGAGFSYQWSTGDSSQVVSVSKSGNYTVTLTDANLCQDTNVFRVQEIKMQPVLFNGDTTFCIGDSTILQVPGFKDYLWSNNAKTDRIIIKVPGTYQVTVTDSNGCTAEAETEVRIWQLPIPTIEGKEKICAVARDTLRVKGNFSSYNWSTGSQQVATLVSNGGWYFVTVTDENGCKGFDSIQVTQLPPLNLAITGNKPFCEGTKATLQATPGFSSYDWSTGSRTDSIQVVNSGTYSVTVSNTDGCIAIQTVPIVRVARPLASTGPNQALNCKTRSIKIGGTSNGAFHYRWSGPDITNQNAALSNPIVTQAGDYQVIVIDTLYGCESDVATVKVTDEAYKPTLALSVADTLDCRNNQVTLTATRQASDSTLATQWFDAQKQTIPNAQTLTLAVNKPGLYYFEMKDNRTGCSATDSVTVLADYSPAEADAGTRKTLTCVTPSVKLDASVTNSTAPLNFSWATLNGNITKDATTLTPEVNKPGLYIFTVSNSKNGCNRSDSVQVEMDQTLPIVDAGANVALNCIVTEASINGTASANGAPFTFNWILPDGSVEKNTSKLLVKQAGVYRLQVTNLNNGCIATDSVTVIDESNYLTIGKAKPVDPTCAGSNNGQIKVEQISGGKAPYFLSVNGSPLEEVTQFNNLKAGTYQIRVEDSEGCGFETNVILNDGRPLEVDLGPADTTIHSLQPFRLEAFVNVPTQTITDIQWRGKITEKCVENCWVQPVSPKKNEEYFVTVMNKAGCKATDSITVNLKIDADYYIPNAFSPNGDGYNDRFMIFFNENVKQLNNLKIFNRWGEQVYARNVYDRSNAWDGKDENGSVFNPGVFVYIIEIEYKNGYKKLDKGDVTLMK